MFDIPLSCDYSWLWFPYLSPFGKTAPCKLLQRSPRNRHRDDQSLHPSKFHSPIFRFLQTFNADPNLRHGVLTLQADWLCMLYKLWRSLWMVSRCLSFSQNVRRSTDADIAASSLATFPQPDTPRRSVAGILRDLLDQERVSGYDS